MLAVAIVVSTIIVAFAFRYAQVTPSIEAPSGASFHYSFDHWTGDFHPER